MTTQQKGGRTVPAQPQTTQKSDNTIYAQLIKQQHTTTKEKSG
jgi:hypothetical protein